jgi:XTP/dITP diphosphohydrolase
MTSGSTAEGATSSSSSADRPVLVIASGNPGKVREFGHLLAALGLDLRPQPEGLDVEETGDTFAANARLKASAVARATGCWALADDSGLSVDALGGAPGVHSARYADSDEARIARLLRELTGASDRSAQFTAALAVADPSGTIRLEVEGICPGVILQESRGYSWERNQQHTLTERWDVVGPALSQWPSSPLTATGSTTINDCLPELFTAISAEVTKKISTLHRIKASASSPGPAASKASWRLNSRASRRTTRSDCRSASRLSS